MKMFTRKHHETALKKIKRKSRVLLTMPCNFLNSIPCFLFAYNTPSSTYDLSKITCMFILPHRHTTTTDAILFPCNFFENLFEFCFSCNLDKVTIYDAESPNVSSIIDVICETVHNKRVFSIGPDLLIEFNASSNQTAKGFRGKFKFVDAIRLKKDKCEYVYIPLVTWK